EIIVSMLTMIPVEIVAINQEHLHATMLYAIATHPQYQHQGFAAALINYTCQYLNDNGSPFSVLVPSGPQLFEFYRRLGYQDGFYIREVSVTRRQIENFAAARTIGGSICSISPEEYNQRRNKFLKGKVHIAYKDQEAAYQGKLSKQSGADIYGLQIEAVSGCAAIERMNSDRILIKELLIPEIFLAAAVRLITELLSAQEYIVRTPAFTGQSLGGSTRPFAMIRACKEKTPALQSGASGFLGLAFD
ncbi:MAG: GNAT family N-acetyltransferase, partial [Methylocystaceae bacterium]